MGKGRRVHRIFPRGGRKFKKKRFSAREARAIFFAPPLGNFRPPSGGGEIFPGGGEKKISVTLKRARSARDFFSPPPEHFPPPPERGAGINFRPPLRGEQQNLRGGAKKIDYLESFDMQSAILSLQK